jgi:hypothetical protein
LEYRVHGPPRELERLPRLTPTPARKSPTRTSSRATRSTPTPSSKSPRRKFEDHYETALVDLINKKRTGTPITPKERPRGENVVDLMDALRKSIGGASVAPRSLKKPAKKSKKAAPGQKEMLMPIAGKKPAKEAAAKKPSAKSQRKSA